MIDLPIVDRFGRLLYRVLTFIPVSCIMVELNGEYMKFYVCDGLLFDSYQMAVEYANEQFFKFDIALNIEQVVKV